MRPKLNPINMIVSNKKYVWSMYYEKDKSVFWFIRSFDGSSFTYKIKDGKTSTIKLVNDYEKNDPHFKNRHSMYKKLLK